MKKFLSIIIIIIFLFSNIIFVNAANGDLSFVSQALSSFMGRFEIPNNYTDFSNKIVYNNNLPYVYMSWYGDAADGLEGGKIEAIVDGNYKIISFKQYFYGNYVGNYKLSKINSIKASNISDEFLKKLCPEYYDKVKRDECEDYYVQNFKNYEFEYIRYENNIPCYENNIKVQVNPYNYKVSSVEVQWDSVERIFSHDTDIKVDDAKVALFNEIGFVKEYIKSNDGEFYIRYYNNSDGRNYINAYTNNILDTHHYSNLSKYRNSLNLVKNFNPLYVKTDENDTDLYQDDYGVYEYVEYIDKYNNQVSLFKDTQKNDLRYLHMDRKSLRENKHLSKDACKQIANKYCGTNLKSFIKECKLLDISNEKSSLGDEIYYFNYTRLINGISYNDNGALIGVSSATGDVVSVSTGWDVVDINAPIKLIDSGSAFSEYIENADFGLQYVISLNNNKKELKLVYDVNPNKDYYVDAVDGTLINNEGAAVSKNVFTDIDDNPYKDKIISMLSLNIIDNNKQFRPSDDIALNDFLMLMYRTVEHNDYQSVDDVLCKFVDLGIVSQDDIVNNQPIKIKDAVKYLVTYLGYGEVANLQDTYKIDYYDQYEISEEYLGYSAIAKGLKLIDGDYFIPNTILKRDYAINLLYNLISN